MRVVKAVGISDISCLRGLWRFLFSSRERMPHSSDAFVHISAVESAGLDGLREGQKIQYELVPGRDGKSAAENLVALD